jgi:hypothetical protein
VTRA